MSAAPRTKITRTSAAIALACLALIAVVWAVTVERITFEREDDIAEAIKRNTNMALALEEHTVRTLKVVDQSLLFLKVEYEEEGNKMPASLPATIGELDPETYTFLSVVDERGEIVASTAKAKLNVADSDYFRYHRVNPGRALHISAPRPGRVSGRMAILVSRRVDHRDGRFAGVVVAGVDPQYFARFYDRVDHGKDGLVQLVGSDGVVFARNTVTGITSRQDMRESTLLKQAALSDAGSFVSLGRLDGVVRHQSFRVLREFGLVVAVGTSEREALEDSRDRSRIYLIGASVATLFMLVFGAALVVSLVRQQRAADAALAGEALYHVTFDQAAVGIAHNTLDGRFLRANSRYCDLVGYSETELRAKNFNDLLHPEDVPSATLMKRLLRDGRIEVANRHVRKDGSIRWASVAIAVARNSAGAPDYLVAMAQDITGRKQVEAQLLEQLDELRRFQRVTVDRELRMLEIEERLREKEREVA